MSNSDEERGFDPSDEDVPHTLSSSWIPEDALRSLVTEKTLNPDESEEQTARRLLRENLPAAVLGIVHTSIHGESSRIRLDAQKYMVERVLGRVGDDAFGDDVSPVDSFAKSMADAMDKIEQMANASAASEAKPSTS
jgi:hypothetical protein